MRPRFLFIVAGLLGCALGLGSYTFVYAKGYSYLTDDPGACANCHIMREQFDGWTRSSHRSVAVCNDCHTPPGVIPKYVTKARNGFWHSFYFTTGDVPRADPDHVDATWASRNRRAGSATAKSSMRSTQPPSGPARLSCVTCHRSVGHLH